jgi:glycosyltransferase involved in cell wall biosynthesis
MKVSAVIPTYNRKEYLGRSLGSVIGQSVGVDEIIVVDDGSTDGSAEYVEANFGSAIRVIRQPNSGVSLARRRGVLEAQSEWIAFLDSDDEWTPDRNELLLAAVERVSINVAWIFGNTLEILDGGKKLNQYEKLGLRFHGDLHVFVDALAAQYPWQFGPLQSSLIRRDALIACHCFTDNLRDSEDRLTGIQIACKYGCAAIRQLVTKLYRTSDLKASSLVYSRDGLDSSAQWADYYRAGMKGFDLAARSVSRQPWGELYAESVRGMCKVHARNGKSSRKLALQQFRYGVSLKSLVFFCGAMFGDAGISLIRNSTALLKRNSY